jgi:YD repeat-containing protein
LEEGASSRPDYTANVSGRGTSTNTDGNPGDAPPAYSATAGGKLIGLPDGTTLEYNTAGQLATVTSNGTGTIANHTYDNNGNRITSTRNTEDTATTTSYRYDEADTLADVTLPGNTSIDYATDGDAFDRPVPPARVLPTTCGTRGLPSHSCSTMAPTTTFTGPAPRHMPR